MRDSVSVVVPAYNEEKNIQSVLHLLLQSKDIDEIIVIDDGSTDNTASILQEIKGILSIKLDQNYGKSYAIAQGIRLAKGDIIVFIDADIQGLQASTISDLITPLQTREYDVCIGSRSNTLEKMMFMPLSGERAYFKKDLLPHLRELQEKGYGLELYLNYLFRDKRIQLVDMDGVLNTPKHLKQSFLTALKEQGYEIKDIFKEILRQKDPLFFFLHAYMYPFYLKRKYKKRKFLDFSSA